MELKDQIMADIKTAMKDKDTQKVNALRLLQSAVKNREIEMRPTPITGEEVMLVVRRLVKQRKESIEQFTAANRQDLVDQEASELKILEVYLPSQLGREQIEKIVSDVIASTGAKTVKEMGLVMKEAQAKAAGAADNKLLSEIVRAKLSS